MNPLRGLVMSGVAAAMLVMTANATDAGCFSHAAACCDPAPVCCPPPPPVSVSWCVQDPCDPCAQYEVTACVPACCAGEIPCLAGCRRGFLGRKILTYEFPGCGHSVEVVITCLGKTIVR